MDLESIHLQNKEIINKLEILNKKIDILIENKDNTILEKMSNHIDFVDSIYDNIKRPFHFLMDTVNSINKKIEI
jgi:hypothetical protein